MVRVLAPLLAVSLGGCLPGQGPIAAIIAISMDTGQPAIVTPCISPAVSYVGVAEDSHSDPSANRGWVIASGIRPPTPVLTQFRFFQTPPGWTNQQSDLTTLQDGTRYNTSVDRAGTGGVGPHFTLADLRSLTPGQVWYYNSKAQSTQDDGYRVSRADFERQARKLCSVRM